MAFTANADHILRGVDEPGFEDAEHNLPHLLQGGLGMADRRPTSTPSPKMNGDASAVEAHIAAVLKLAGVADPQARAARVLSWSPHRPGPRPGLRGPRQQARTIRGNAPTSSARPPGMDWGPNFEAPAFPAQSDFLVWHRRR